MSENKPQEDNTEKQPSLVDLLYDKLGLPEVQGSQMAMFSFIRELTLELKLAGVLSGEKIEEMINRVENRLLKAHQNMLEDTKADKELATVVFGRFKESGLESLQKLREHVGKEN